MMIKLLILMIVFYSIWIIKNEQKEKAEKSNKQISIYYILHIVLGIIITIFFTIHGISKISNVSIGSSITGIIAVLLLYSELVTGTVCIKNKKLLDKKVKTVHKFLPIILLCAIFLHILINKII
ncbi:MAG: hypothetical protein ACLRHC_07475 [Anaerovoracaceae bacterium]